MSIRNMAGMTAFVLLLGGLAAEWQWHREREAHLQWYRTVDCLIIQIADQQPPDLSDSQWAMSLSHTWNLHVNYGGFDNWTPQSRQRFIDAFRQKLKDQNGFTTIEWFWDAYIAAVPRAKGYRHYYPFQPSLMQEASVYDLNDIRRSHEMHGCTHIDSLR